MCGSCGQRRSQGMLESCPTYGQKSLERCCSQLDGSISLEVPQAGCDCCRETPTAQWWDDHQGGVMGAHQVGGDGGTPGGG